MRLAGCLVFALVFAGIGNAQQTVSDYRNPNLPIEQRVADLLSRMTLEEKVDQLAPGRSRAELETDDSPEAKQLREKMRELFKDDSTVSPRDAAALRNGVQKYEREKTRLGIPVIFFGEALHGYMAYAATSFPQVLGLASTWNPELVRQVFTAAADEMSAAGTNQAFTPVLDLARDPRWGRTEETYGEDPFLVSRMGVAAIEGLQGTSVFDRSASCAGDGQAFRGAWPAGRRHQHGAGQLFRARDPRIVSAAVSGGGRGGACGKRHGFL